MEHECSAISVSATTTLSNIVPTNLSKHLPVAKLEDGAPAVHIRHDITTKLDSMTCFTYGVSSDNEHNDQSDVAKPDLATFDALKGHAKEESDDGGDALERIEESSAINHIASSMERPPYNQTKSSSPDF